MFLLWTHAAPCYTPGLRSRPRFAVEDGSLADPRATSSCLTWWRRSLGLSGGEGLVAPGLASDPRHEGSVPSTSTLRASHITNAYVPYMRH